ncbi:LysR substrate binding domain protein [compost metagenome]
MQFSGLGEAIRSVMAGYGANFISSLAVREYVEQKQLSRVRVEGIQLSNHIAICTRSNESVPAALQQFIDICRSFPPVL